MAGGSVYRLCSEGPVGGNKDTMGSSLMGVVGTNDAMGSSLIGVVGRSGVFNNPGAISEVEGNRVGSEGRVPGKRLGSVPSSKVEGSRDVEREVFKVKGVESEVFRPRGLERSCCMSMGVEEGSRVPSPSPAVWGRLKLRTGKDGRLRPDGSDRSRGREVGVAGTIAGVSRLLMLMS